jgi:hypothetical protein
MMGGEIGSGQGRSVILVADTEIGTVNFQDFPPRLQG